MSTPLLMSATLALTFFITLAASLLLTRPGMHVGLDHPNDRSLHELPTPRTGGLAILAGLLAGGLFYSNQAVAVSGVPLVLAVSALAVVVISFLDDLWRLPALMRIIVQAGAAYSLLAYASLATETLNLPWAGYALPAWAAWLFSGLLIVWVTNLYNFMDGIDGLAAGMGVFGFATFGILGLMAAAPGYAAYAFIVAVACLGFLGVNFPPARIFMGDVGSSLLGFLAAGFALWADRECIFPLWVGILIFSPFVVDATVTLLRRLCNREAVWRAHRSHFYQRLVLLGWSHRRTTLSTYGLMAASGLSAMGAMRTSSTTQIGFIIAWVLIYLILMVRITRMEQSTRNLKDSVETGTTA